MNHEPKRNPFNGPRLSPQPPQPASRNAIKAPGQKNVSLIDLTSGACRYPCGETAGGMHLFCGAPVNKKGSAYCAHHDPLAYTFVPARKAREAIQKFVNKPAA